MFYNDLNKFGCTCNGTYVISFKLLSNKFKNNNTPGQVYFKFIEMTTNVRFFFII